MDKPVLLKSQVDEGSECGQVIDLPGEFHTDMEVVDGAHLVVIEGFFGILSRVTARFFEFGDNIGEGRESDLAGGVFLEVDFSEEVRISDEAVHVDLHVLCYAVDEFVTFGVDTGIVERIGTSGNTEKAGALLEGLLTHSRYFQEVFASLEGAVLVAVLYDIGGKLLADTGDVGEERS